MNVIVSRKELLAALIFASRDETRFALCGVCIEQRPKSPPLMIATDGRRLSVIESQAVQEGTTEYEHTVVLMPDFINAICRLSKAVGGKLFPWMSITNKAGSERVDVNFIGCDCVLNAEKNALFNMPYSNWRAAIPDCKDRTPLNELGINPEYMTDYRKVAKVLDFPEYQVRLNLIGEDMAVEVKINGLHYFYGLVMPLKLEEKVNYQPEFLGMEKLKAA